MPPLYSLVSLSASPEDVVPVRLLLQGGRSMGVELAGLLQDTGLGSKLPQDLLLGHQHVQGSAGVLGALGQEAQGGSAVT